MNRKDLKKVFDKHGVPSHRYDLEGHMRHDVTTIEKQYYGWIVYYSEKGEKSYKKCFSNENDACEYMKKRILDHIEFAKKYKKNIE